MPLLCGRHSIAMAFPAAWISRLDSTTTTFGEKLLVDPIQIMVLYYYICQAPSPFFPQKN